MAATVAELHVDSVEAHGFHQGNAVLVEAAGAKVMLATGAGDFFLPFDGARN